MNNRLADLKKGSGAEKSAPPKKKAPAKSSDESEESSDGDIEMGKITEETQEAAGPEFMSDFFENVNTIKAGVKKMEKNMEALEHEYQEQLQKIGADKKVQQQVVDSLIDDTSAVARDIQNRLKKMAERTEKEKSDVGPAESRIRQNLHSTLLVQFTDTMQKYQDIQSKYRQQFKDMAKKQIKIANPSATDDQIDEAIESGNTDRIFSDQSLQRHEAAKQALNYVKDKYKEILKIEQSLSEVYQMFVDMAALVAEQSEVLQQIEGNIDKTMQYTKDAVVELKQANKMAKKSRKTLCILVILAIILVVAGLVLGLVFGLMDTGGTGSPS